MDMFEEVGCFVELFAYAGFVELGGEDDYCSPFVRWFEEDFLVVGFKEFYCGIDFFRLLSFDLGFDDFGGFKFE